MKQEDIALVLISVGVSAMFSFVVGNYILGGTSRSTDVEVVKPISSDFQLPDARFYNSQSLNPTLDITIGDDGNQLPFNEQTTN